MLRGTDGYIFKHPGCDRQVNGPVNLKTISVIHAWGAAAGPGGSKTKYQTHYGITARTDRFFA
jgi:hypothetical protein